MAEHGHRRRARPVVIRRKHAPGEGADSEHREVTSRDVLGAQGLGGRVAFPPNAFEPTAGLESSRLFKFWCSRLQPFIQRERIESPTVLRPPFDAAFVAFADTVESGGISNRQGPQHHRVNQGEDGGRSADSQRQREHRRGGKNRSAPELPHRVAQIANQVSHYRPPPFHNGLELLRVAQ